MSLSLKDFFRLLKEPTENTIDSSHLNNNYGPETASTAHLFSKIESDVATQTQNKSLLLDNRISPARVFNWTRGIINAPLAAKNKLTLIDAGIDCNIPIAPLLRPERAIDIIIILDASAGVLGTQLYNAQMHANKWGYPFPRINYNLINQPCSIHWDKSNNQAPMVIYLPLIKNPGYDNDWDPFKVAFTSTYNFIYSPEQTQLLSGLTSYNMSQSMPLIMDMIAQWIESKSNQT